MRILQVTSFFKPSWEAGGIARVSYEISRRLAENNEVTVYTTDGFKKRLNVKKNQPLEFENMNVYYFKNLSNRLASKNFCLPLMFPRVVKKNLKKFDIIHMHTFRSFLGICIRRYAKIYDVPYIIQTHGSVLPLFQKQGLKRIFDLFFGYNILKDASKIIALNKMEARHYRKMGVAADKIEIVPNGIDLSEYNNLPKKGEFRKKYSIGHEEKLILYLGRIHKIKGVDLLINAFADLLTKMHDIDIKLAIVGPDDGFLSSLKLQTKNLGIDDKVLFVGPLYGKGKLEAYVDADVYVLPSRYETFPSTVLEASACGTPIIFTDRCGIAEYFDSFGCVVKYDKNVLKNKLFSLLNNKKVKIRNEKTIRTIIVDKFDFKKIIEKYVEIYADCIR